MKGGQNVNFKSFNSQSTAALLMNLEFRMGNWMVHLVSRWPKWWQHHSWAADVFVNTSALCESQ